MPTSSLCTLCGATAAASYCAACDAVLQESLVTAANRDHAVRRDWLKQEIDKAVPLLIDRSDIKKQGLRLVDFSQKTSTAHANHHQLAPIAFSEMLIQGFRNESPILPENSAAWRMAYNHQKEEFIIRCYAASHVIKRFQPKMTTRNGWISLLKELKKYIGGEPGDAFIFEQSAIAALWRNGYYRDAIERFYTVFPTADCFLSIHNDKSLPENQVEYDFHGLNEVAFLAYTQVLMHIAMLNNPPEKIRFVFGRSGTVLRESLKLCFNNLLFDDTALVSDDISVTFSSAAHKVFFNHIKKELIAFDQKSIVFEEQKKRIELEVAEYNRYHHAYSMTLANLEEAQRRKIKSEWILSQQQLFFLSFYHMIQRQYVEHHVLKEKMWIVSERSCFLSALYRELICHVIIPSKLPTIIKTETDCRANIEEDQIASYNLMISQNLVELHKNRWLIESESQAEFLRSKLPKKKGMGAMHKRFLSMRKLFHECEDDKFSLFRSQLNLFCESRSIENRKKKASLLFESTVKCLDREYLRGAQVIFEDTLIELDFSLKLQEIKLEELMPKEMNMAGHLLYSIAHSQMLSNLLSKIPLLFQENDSVENTSFDEFHTGSILFFLTAAICCIVGFVKPGSWMSQLLEHPSVYRPVQNVCMVNVFIHAVSSVELFFGYQFGIKSESAKPPALGM